MSQPTLTFFTNPHSRGRIIRWMLEELGEPYETRIIEYGEHMKSPEYLAINPMGKVPAIRHGEAVVTECPAICAYLADAFPAAGLAPPHNERADYYRWLFFAAGPLEAATTNKALGFTLPEDRQVMAGYGTLEDTVNTLAWAVERHPYIAGERFSAADVYVGMSIYWGLRFEMIDRRDSFEAYVQRVTDREGFRRAEEIDGPMG
jgi:glutathione S-transferase